MVAVWLEAFRTMSSDLRESPSDPLLAFASEAPSVQTRVPEQSPVRTATQDGPNRSIVRVENRRPQRSHVWLVGTVSMAVGILVGLGADIALWQRLFTQPV